MRSASGAWSCDHRRDIPGRHLDVTAVDRDHGLTGCGVLLVGRGNPLFASTHAKRFQLYPVGLPDSGKRRTGMVPSAGLLFAENHVNSWFLVYYDCCIGCKRWIESQYRGLFGIDR